MASPDIPNRGPVLLAVNIAFLTVAVISYALRCYVRIFMVKAFGRDDYLMAVATLGFIAYMSSSTLGVHYGTGKHRWDLPVKNYEQARHCWWFCYLFYCCSMIGSKMSIGVFLLRIAVKKLHLYIIYFAMLISVVSCMAFFFVTLFECKPISFFWDTTSQSGTCIDPNIIVALGYLYSVFSIISDFTFAILPGFLIMGLQLKTRTKLALVPLLAMGCIASGAVVARAPQMKTLRSRDFLWDTTYIAIWSTVEQGLAITAGSLATLRPLFTIVLSKLGLTSHQSKATPYGYGVKSSTGFGERRSTKPAHELDLYKISAEIESGPTRDNSSEIIIRAGSSAEDAPKSPNWYASGLEKIKRGSRIATPTEKKGDSESEKSLKTKDNKSQSDLTATRTSSEDRTMAIMVERSFFVSEAERQSYLDQQDPKAFP